MDTSRRPVRIGGASGGFTDRVSAITRLASEPNVDAIVGDWLSENTMAPMGAAKANKNQHSIAQSLEDKKKSGCFASTLYVRRMLQRHKLPVGGIKD